MNLFQNYLAEEFVEEYAEGRLPRRAALKLIAAVTGSLVVAESLLAGCAPAPDTVLASTATSHPAAAIPTGASPGGPAATGSAGGATSLPSGTVGPDDPDIDAGVLEIPADGSTLLAYQAHPRGSGPFAVVLVCHENRGLTEHIRDVGRRLAKAGYAALAVDLLSRAGGTEAVGFDNAPGALVAISPDQFARDFQAGWQYLRQQPYASADRVGMVGFCFGGGVTWLVATRMPELRAAVPFYGPHPPVEDVPAIQAPVLAIYAGNDQRINQGIPAIEAAMQAHAKVYEKAVYPGVDHAFHNDTGSRYNAEAAQDAWRRTLEWFGGYLG